MTADAPQATSPATSPDSASVDEMDPLYPSLWWRICRMILRPLMVFYFDLKVYDRHHVPATGGVLLVSNHQSYLDPVLVGVYLRRPLSYLAKAQLFKNKYFGFLIRSLRAFPVKKGAGDIAAVKEMIRRLRQGHMLNLYPEGSRTETGEIGEIESGAALVVRRAGVAIVPCVVEGSYQAWPKGRKLFHAGRIDVMYGPALDIEGKKAAEITELVGATLKRMLGELRDKRKRR